MDPELGLTCAKKVQLTVRLFSLNKTIRERTLILGGGWAGASKGRVTLIFSGRRGGSE